MKFGSISNTIHNPSDFIIPQISYSFSGFWNFGFGTRPAHENTLRDLKKKKKKKKKKNGIYPLTRGLGLPFAGFPLLPFAGFPLFPLAAFPLPLLFCSFSRFSPQVCMLTNLLKKVIFFDWIFRKIQKKYQDFWKNGDSESSLAPRCLHGFG